MERFTFFKKDIYCIAFISKRKVTQVYTGFFVRVPHTRKKFYAGTLILLNMRNLACHDMSIKFRSLLFSVNSFYIVLVL